jgi:hypothetical protein
MSATTMVRRAVLALLVVLAAAAAPAAATAGLRVASTVAFTRSDGTAVAIPLNLRVWCGRWERNVRERTLHVRAGRAGGPLWHLRAVVADVRRRPVVHFPHSFNFDEPSGAQLFAVDGTNELSSAEEEASGRISFGSVRCGRRLAVRFRVRAVLGSEVGGEELTVRGSFRASKR